MNSNSKIIIVGIYSFVIGLFSCKENKKNVSTDKLRVKSAQIDTTKFYPVNSKDNIQPVYTETAKYL